MDTHFFRKAPDNFVKLVAPGACLPYEYLYKFKCNLCDKRFRRKETLKRHVSIDPALVEQHAGALVPEIEDERVVSNKIN